MHCASCWSQQNRWSLNGLYSFFGHIFDLKLVGPKVEEMRGADCGRMDVICSNDERRLWGPWRAQILKPTKEEEFSILSDWKDFNKAAKAVEEVKMRSTEMLFLHEKKERPEKLRKVSNPSTPPAWFYKNMQNPASFSFIFGLFEQTIQILQQTWKMSGAGIRTHVHQMYNWPIRNYLCRSRLKCSLYQMS